jgi:cytochrome c oxidase assembly protein subunit 15
VRTGTATVSSVSASTAPVQTTSDNPPSSPLRHLRSWSRGILIANLVAQIVIVVTGGAVRLTASGLGCSSWPQCEPGHFTPAHIDASSYHAAIEFGNRTVTGLLLVVTVLVALVVWTDRGRSLSYRTLGLVPLAGVVLQAVIGGISVLVRLNPAIVGSHLLISMGLVAVSTLLLRRSTEGDSPAQPTVDGSLIVLSRALAVSTVAVLALGVVVTGSGPHSGDAEVGYRFGFDPAAVARVHALSVWVFLVLLGLLIVGLVRRPSPPLARRAALVVLATALVQGAIGYVQFFTGLPAFLVGLHMFAAALLTAATTWLLTSLRQRT